MLKYMHTLYIWITRINFGQKLSLKNMALLVSLPDQLYRYLHISPAPNLDQYLRSYVSPIIGGKKGRNIYVAPYCDRMWHDSCNIF